MINLRLQSLAALLGASQLSRTIAVSVLPRGGTFQDINFDDIDTCAPPVNIPSVAPKLYYKDLLFDNFFCAINNPDNPLGQATSSPPNRIIYNPLRALVGSAQITSDFPDSKVEGFDLEQLCYGCALGAQNGAANPAVNCSIEVIPDGNSELKEVLEYTEAYTVDEILWAILHGEGGSPSACTDLKNYQKFKHLRSVQFRTVPEGLAFGLDDVGLTLYYS